MMDKPPESEPSESSLRRILSFFGIGRSPDTAEDLEQELQELLEEGEEHGLISSREGLMINRILDLKDTLVREVMTPRTEIVCAPADASIENIVALIREKGFSRIPIYADNPDHIVGIVHAKDLLSHLGSGDAKPAGEITNPAAFVLETEQVAELLKNFQQNKTHLAIVTDEFGITRGLVTLEDILEEIVGDIADEYDREETCWNEINPDTLVTDAKVRLEAIEEYFKLQLPDGPYESVGGLLIDQLGRVPQTGTVVTIAPLIFTVILATKRRILTVQIKRAPE